MRAKLGTTYDVSSQRLSRRSLKRSKKAPPSSWVSCFSKCQQTWRTIRHTLDQLKVVRYRMHGKTIVQSTQVTSTMAKLLRSLGIPLPKRILEVSDEAHASYLP